MLRHRVPQRPHVALHPAIRRGGIATVAQSGIDLALWDLKGKLLEQPVYRLLGGPCRDKIDIYVTSDDLDWSMELGFHAFKVSNPVHYEEGIDGLNILDEHIGKARDMVGYDVELMYNPVMSFNVEFAIRVAERLRKYGLRWLEEPLIPTDLEGHIELKKAINWVPLATGEDHHGRHAFRQLIEHRAIDIAQPDLKWCGGLTEAVKIYTIAEAAGIATIPPRRRRHTLRPALLLRNARIPNGRVLDGLRPRRPPGGSLPHTRHAHAQRRLRHPIRRPRLRHGNQGRVGSPLGPYGGDEDPEIEYPSPGKCPLSPRERARVRGAQKSLPPRWGKARMGVMNPFIVSYPTNPEGCRNGQSARNIHT
ncbi:L-rhamnonate dehydratase [Geodia barretti]|uniref:L-rhamnonate dehydratase n=1 Tax=Geodia barretti TaxID=519541 RepID=A0AA35QVA7_GEOBA|nr:L-rhamnonate dehydratase [Geodia barretti]